jgi:hypothetical protein
VEQAAAKDEMKHETIRSGEAGAGIFWQDRRAHPRHVLVRRSGIVHGADGSRQPCLIVNISAGGLLARTYRPSVAGDRVRIEMVPGETIAGAVLWAQDWSIGVAFDELIDVEALLAREWVSEEVQDRRRSPRHPVSCPASLRIGTRFHYGRICDISSGGVRFRARKALKKIGPALLTLPDLPPLPAAIAWRRGEDCGLVFEEAIPDEALATWLAARTKSAA